MVTEYIYRIDDSTKVLLDAGLAMETSHEKREILLDYIEGEYIVTTTNVRELQGYVGVNDPGRFGLQLYKATNLSQDDWTPDPLMGPDPAAEEDEELPDIVIATFPERSVDIGDISNRSESEKVTDLIPLYKNHLKNEENANKKILIPIADAINVIAGATYSWLTSAQLLLAIQESITEYDRLETDLIAAATVAACDAVLADQNWPDAIPPDPP